jgi:hypothetical protein
MAFPFAHVFGVPVEETLLAVAPVGIAVVAAVRLTGRRVRRSMPRRPARRRSASG